ncbi:hypothetical protein LINPERHAP1_LOCUS6269 [Linum perenne]
MSQSRIITTPNSMSASGYDNTTSIRRQSGHLSPQQRVVDAAITGTRKRTRGTTMCKNIWGLQDGERIPILINQYGQPIGKNASRLGYFLGVLARKATYAPLQYEDWRLMPETHKTEMWNMVQEKFDINILAKPWVLTSLDNKWKNFKATVKREWTKRKIRDKRVCNDDWEWLLKFWNTDKAKKRESVAKDNRNSVPSAHTMGTKSYARTRAEMKQSRPDKSEPSRVEVYIQSHVRADGKPLNDKVAEIIAKLKDVMQSNTAPLDESGELDLLAQAMGKKKCKHNITYGLGSLHGTKNSRMSIVKEALVAKNNAEERERRVQEEMAKMMEKQEKILMLLQRSNPHINLNEIMDSTNQEDDDLTQGENYNDDLTHGGNYNDDDLTHGGNYNDDDLTHGGNYNDDDLTHGGNYNDDVQVEEGNNMGIGPLFPLTQSSPTTLQSQSQDVPNCILDTFLPLYRNLPPKASSSIPINKGTGQKHVRDPRMNEMDAVRDQQNELDTPSQEISFVILKSLQNPDHDVAKGCIMSKQSKTVVGDKELGEGFYEIFVEIPIKASEPLVRPYGSFQTIGDVVGQTIAWPSFFEFEIRATRNED